MMIAYLHKEEGGIWNYADWGDSIKMFPHLWHFKDTLYNEHEHLNIHMGLDHKDGQWLMFFVATIDFKGL